VRVYDLDAWDGKEFFTMEWVEGETLRVIIADRKKAERPFSLDEAYRIISQLSDALSHAHKLTIHRDIKPENILVTRDKDLKVKLSDFGIAKMLSPSQFTSTSVQMGTPYYMAPEQKVDAANVDKRADIYALGVVLFELLTLENTIGLDLPSEINKSLPKEIDNVIKKALATKPDDRYGDVKELSDALKKVVDRTSERAERDQKEVEEQQKREEEKRLREAEERKQKEADQQKEQEEEKRLDAELLRSEDEKNNTKEREDAEKARREEQKKMEEEHKSQTVATEKTFSVQQKFWPYNKIIIAFSLLFVLVGAYLYITKMETNTVTDDLNGSLPPAVSESNNKVDRETKTPLLKQQNNEQLLKVPETKVNASASPTESQIFVSSSLTVLNKKTGVMWTRNANISGRIMDYKEAIAFIKKLNNENYAGYSNWRLPTRDEFSELFKDLEESIDKAPKEDSSRLAAQPFLNIQQSKAYFIEDGKSFYVVGLYPKQFLGAKGISEVFGLIFDAFSYHGVLSSPPSTLIYHREGVSTILTQRDAHAGTRGIINRAFVWPVRLSQ
jgi:serine/threonine protein kinase